MKRTYDYKGFTLEVSVEANFSAARRDPRSSAGYVAIVTIGRTGGAVATFAPLRLGDAGGQSFTSEGDALMAGYSAARRIVEDLQGTGS